MQSREFAEFQESEEAVGGLETAGTVNVLFTTTARGGDHHHYYNSTMKRRSPSSSSPQEPPQPSKKGRPPISPKIVSPPPPPSSSSSPSSTSVSFLRRCFSDPMNSPPGANNLGLFSNPQQPNLGRSVSDPIHHPTPSSTDIGFNESPSSKRLKKMKECIRDSSERLNQVLHEGEEDFEKEESESKCETEEEAVSVEKTEEGLLIHFKCPCTKGYQILLSGNNCYYKLW